MNKERDGGEGRSGDSGERCGTKRREKERRLVVSIEEKRISGEREVQYGEWRIKGGGRGEEEKRQDTVCVDLYNVIVR